MITLRYRLKDVKVEATEKEFKAGDTDLPAGIVPRRRRQRARVQAEVEKLGLTAVALAAAPEVPMHDSTCRASRSSAPGATRRTSAGCATRSTSSRVPYDLIYKERVKKGDLRAPTTSS